MKHIVCYGEVLWDMLPTGKKLGGAPLNVALRAQSYACDAKMISSIGKDAPGEDIVEQMKTQSACLEHLQVSDHFETSEVLVTLDDTGSASYEIKMPCAWDDIQLRDKDVAAVKKADAFIFGSLVARQATSRDTLLALLKVSAYNVFDVNLRQPHYTLDTLVRLMGAAHFIKFNDDEIFEICGYMGAKDLLLEECVKFIAKKTDTQSICVTMGGDGAMVYHNDKFIYNKGYEIVVADTVGAGDSFLGTLMSQLLAGESHEVALDFACAVGALVASKQGANPKVSTEEIVELMKQE